VETFIFSCLDSMQTDCDEWEWSSIVAATTVAGLTVLLGITVSLYQTDGNSFVCQKFRRDLLGL